MEMKERQWNVTNRKMLIQRKSKQQQLMIWESSIKEWEFLHCLKICICTELSHHNNSMTSYQFRNREPIDVFVIVQLP